jgi:large subunit ribosomal protein L30e
MSTKKLREALKEKNVIFGSEETIKQLKLGKVKKVFVSRNCKEDVKERIRHYCEVGNVELVEMKEANDELGVICKKPFAISVVSV